MVSTLASHAGNEGSNPSGGTKLKLAKSRFFYFNRYKKERLIRLSLFFLFFLYLKEYKHHLTVVV